MPYENLPKIKGKICLFVLDKICLVSVHTPPNIELYKETKQCPKQNSKNLIYNYSYGKKTIHQHFKNSTRNCRDYINILYVKRKVVPTIS